MLIYMENDERNWNIFDDETNTFKFGEFVDFKTLRKNLIKEQTDKLNKQLNDLFYNHKTLPYQKYKGENHMGLYKAKRVDNNEWIVGNLIYTHSYNKNSPYIVSDAILINQQRNGKYIEEVFSGFYQVQPNTICQASGLTDVEDNMIFDKDIVIPIKQGNKIPLLVNYDNYCWKMIIPNNNEYKYYQHRLEPEDKGRYKIIGNIFDNGDLLSGD